MSKRTQRRAQARRGKGPVDTGYASGGRRVTDMAERQRRAPKSATEWQSLMNQVVPELIKLADPNGDFEGPLTPETERIVRERGLDCNATGLIDRLKAIGWIEDYGRVSGATRKYHFRRDAVPVDQASRAEYLLKKERAKLNADAAARKTAEKAAGPAPEVAHRVDKDQIIPGKQVMVAGPQRPTTRDIGVERPLGKPTEPEQLREPARLGDLHDSTILKVSHLTAKQIVLTELQAAHEDVEALKTQLKEVGEDRDRARELATGLRGRLAKADTLIDTILSGDPQTVQVIRTAIEYDRRHGTGGS